MRSPLLIAIAFLALSTTGCHRSGKADGVVLDLLTGLPVDQALVKVEGTSVSVTTDKRGRYYLLDIKPGTYKITASKGGFLSVAQVEIVVRKGEVVHAPQLEVVSIPPQAGIFQPGDPLVTLVPFPADSFKTDTDNRLYLETAAFPQVPSLVSPLNLVVYNGQADFKGSLDLHAMMFVPNEGASGADSFTNPGRWVVLAADPKTYESKSLAPNLNTLGGEIALGRYALQVKPEAGAETWYLFDIEKNVKPVAATVATATASEAAAPAGVPKELLANVESIRTTEKDYKDAFGVYLPVKDPVPRKKEALNANPVAWTSGSEFDSLGWAPEGKVAGIYWVEVNADGTDFTVHGMILDDKDKPVHYVASRNKAPTAAP